MAHDTPTPDRGATAPPRPMIEDRSGRGIIIAVHLDDVVRYGPRDAVVLQQIRHYAEGGWWRKSSAELASHCGMSAPQVRRAVAALMEAGAVERRQESARTWDQTYSYRATDSAVDETVTSTVDEIVTSGVDEIVNSSLGDTETTKNPPAPLGGGNDGAAGQLDLGPAAVTRAERRQRSKSEGFEQWWRALVWPGRKGSKQSARRAWDKARALDGVSLAELDQQIGHYLDARARYAELWDRPPTTNPPMVSTFLNTKRHEFIRPLDDAGVAAYWPAPKGKSWDRVGGAGRAPTVAEILAQQDDGGDQAVAG